MPLRLTLFILLSFSIHFCYGCSCANNTDLVKVSLGYSDIAFKGTLLSRKIVEKPIDTIYIYDDNGKLKSIYKPFDEDAYMLYTLTVDEVYKGKIKSDTIKIRGPVRSSCMATITFGQPYFIFAYSNNGIFKKKYYSTGYCAGNKKFNEEDHDLLTER